MLTVYAIPVSLYCAKLRIVLRHKGLGWREVAPPGGYGSDEYKRIVPSGNLPALVDGDLLLADSEAIAEYLNEQHTDPPMLPAEPEARAKARERSRFHDTRLEPAVRALFPLIPPGQPDPAVADAQSRTITTRLEQFARTLEDPTPPIPEDLLTLGDCGFPITFTWIEALTPILGLTVEWPDAIATYRETLARHPAVRAEFADYGPKLTAWLRSREAA
jgi:glutathione S-transferase/maleylpyruvate isomerase